MSFAELGVLRIKMIFQNHFDFIKFYFSWGFWNSKIFNKPCDSQPIKLKMQAPLRSSLMSLAMKYCFIRSVDVVHVLCDEKTVECTNISDYSRHCAHKACVKRGALLRLIKMTITSRDWRIKHLLDNIGHLNHLCRQVFLLVRWK